jgi:hypothetical protein
MAWLFRKTFHMKSVFWFSLWHLSEAFLNPRRIPAVIINLPTSSCKVPLFFSDFNQIFFNDFNKNSSNKFQENPSSGGPSCCIRTDRQMDGKTCMHITKRTVDFPNFANASKNWRFQFSLLRQSFTYFCWSVYCYLPMWRRIIFALCTKWLHNNEMAVDINGLTYYHLSSLIVLPLNEALYPRKQRK